MAAEDDNNPTEVDVADVDPINRDCDSFHEDKLQIAGPDALPSIICLTSALNANIWPEAQNFNN